MAITADFSVVLIIIANVTHGCSSSVVKRNGYKMAHRHSANAVIQHELVTLNTSPKTTVETCNTDSFVPFKRLVVIAYFITLTFIITNQEHT